MVAEGHLQGFVLMEPQEERWTEVPLFTFSLNLPHFIELKMSLILRLTIVLYTAKKENNSTWEAMTHPDALISRDVKVWKNVYIKMWIIYVTYVPAHWKLDLRRKMNTGPDHY